MKPKIKLDVKKAGTYDIYIKLFDAKGDLNTNSNSPSGYTTKTEIDVTQGIHEYPLVGRGLDEDGYWSAGNYKFEFYYDGKLLGKLNFKVN